ncbi:MAG TPA: branched-chain amino acid ABC transporter permease [bacterium]|nr:branched-chain amino acid ABC transporter permease [bacterium]
MFWAFLTQSLINGLLTGGVYGLIAVGLTLIFGVMKIINFAHGSLMMLGMYATFWAWSALHLDPYASLIVSVPLLFVLGALIQKFLVAPVMNAPEHNQLLLTLGIALFVENAALFAFTADPRFVQTHYLSVNYYVGPLTIKLVHLIAFGASLLITLLLYLLLSRTDLGKAIRAAAEEPEGALLMGIDVRRIFWISFGIGSACVGAAGTLISPFFPVDPHVGGLFVITAFVVVVLGGMGSFGGALLGGIIVGVGESVGAMFLPGSMKQMVTFVLFVLILLFRPNGLFGRRMA